MPKPPLFREDSFLEGQIIETLLAGLHDWRSDLDYPESHSDMAACVRGLLKMFDVKRRPIVSPLRIECHDCDGIGKWRVKLDEYKTCTTCKGKGWIPGE